MNWYVLSKKKKKKDKKKSTNTLPLGEDFYYTTEDGVLMYKTPSMETPMIAEGENIDKISNVQT